MEKNALGFHKILQFSKIKQRKIFYDTYVLKIHKILWLRSKNVSALMTSAKFVFADLFDD